MTIEKVAVHIRQTLNQELKSRYRHICKLAIEHVTVQIRQTLNQEISLCYKHVCKQVPINGHRTCDSPNPPDSKPRNKISLMTHLQTGHQTRDSPNPPDSKPRNFSLLQTRFQTSPYPWPLDM
jgi:hypothetical protein